MEIACANRWVSLGFEDSVLQYQLTNQIKLLSNTELLRLVKVIFCTVYLESIYDIHFDRIN